MGIIKVDINTIDTFKEDIKVCNDKLLLLIDKMESESLPLNDFFKGATGNLYNETLIDILRREKEYIKQVDTLFTGDLDRIKNRYTNSNEKIKKSVID